MTEQLVDVPTDGLAMPVFVCHPDGSGPFPVVIFYMDAPGFREELFAMCRRIAAAGFYVALPNLYYRHGAAGILSAAATDPQDPEFQRMFALMGSLSIDGVLADTAALFRFLDRQEAASPGVAGVLGYCMSGPFVLCVAAAHPGRVQATVAFYGVGMVTDRPDSPHLRLGRAAGELYVGFAELDAYAPVSQIAPLRAQTDAAQVSAEYEVFPATDHGFCFPLRHTFNAAAAEQHWTRMLQVFGRVLRRAKI